MIICVPIYGHSREENNDTTMKRYLFLTIAALLAIGVQAQSSDHRTLSVKAADQDGKPVAGAHVQVNLHEGVTDEQGICQFDLDHNENLDFGIIATAPGHAAYEGACEFDETEYQKQEEITLYNTITYKAGIQSTLVLPITPDTSWGRYYRLDRVESNKIYFERIESNNIIFEREPNPQAYCPYVFIPYQDLSINLNDNMNLRPGINRTFVTYPYNIETEVETLSEEGEVSFVGSHSYNTTGVVIMSWNYLHVDDAVPDDPSYQPMHAKLFYKGLFKGEPKLIFHDPKDNYRPLVEEGKRWTYVYSYDHPAYSPYNYWYYLHGDTVIGGQKCLKMFSENYNNDNIVRYEGSLYEENKKVYAFFPEHDTADLLYDFDCEVDDEIRTSEGRMLVTDIVQDESGDKIMRTYHLFWFSDDGNRYIEGCTWIEGIGSCIDLFQTVPTYGNASGLYRCEVNGEILYPFVLPDPSPAYRPFIDEKNVWTYCNQGHAILGGTLCELSFTKYYFDGEREIDGKTYKALWGQNKKYRNNRRSSMPEMWHIIDVIDTKEPFYYLGFREENGKVFVNAEEYNKWIGDKSAIQFMLEENMLISEGSEYILCDIKLEEPEITAPYVKLFDYLYFAALDIDDGVARTSFLNLVFRGDNLEYKSPYFMSDPFFPRVIDFKSYHPFIEAGKAWHIMVSDQENPEQKVMTEVLYYFTNDTVMVDGKNYLPMYSRKNSPKSEVKSHGLFREEEARVYYRPSAEEPETLVYDFSLIAGDEVILPLLSDEPLRVTNVGKIELNGEQLKTISFNDSESPDWIEGIGYTSTPLRCLEPALPGMTFEYITYVSYSDDELPLNFNIENLSSKHNYYLPLSVVDYGEKSIWRGQPLYLAERLSFDNPNDSLSYELIPNADGYDLHVTGRMVLGCGPNHYLYCQDDASEDAAVRKISITAKDVSPYVDCVWMWNVDFTIPNFAKEYTYFATDKQGEHLVPVNDKMPAYRPFVEENKEWVIGFYFDTDGSAVGLEHYYFDGDTIIQQRPCKKMMCRYEYIPEVQTPLYRPRTEYVGAIYDENRQVYWAKPKSREFVLLYDFAAPEGAFVDFYSTQKYEEGASTCYVIKKWKSEDSTFHGWVSNVGYLYEINNPEEYDSYGLWREGVGNQCLTNVVETWNYTEQQLISCIAGDEILYFDATKKIDPSLSIDSEVKKHWLDFTHTTKPRPKSPKRVSVSEEGASNEGEQQETLTGEYSAKELFVSLKTLAGTYTITLTDATGKEVYRKEVQTSNVVALNTDLTKYAEGTYTLTVENSEEQYTASLSLPIDDDAVRDLKNEKSVNGKFSNSKWLDLSGRRLTTSPTRKGVYIKDGRKVLVK